MNATAPIRMHALPACSALQAMFTQAVLDDPQQDAQGDVQSRPVTLQKVAQPLRHRQHPLAHGQVGGRRGQPGALPSLPCVECCRRMGHQVVVPIVITPDPRKAVGEDGALRYLRKACST